MEEYAEKGIRCSWCDFGKFYPLFDSELICTCAQCGEFKTLEDVSVRIITEDETLE